MKVEGKDLRWSFDHQTVIKSLRATDSPYLFDGIDEVGLHHPLTMDWLTNAVIGEDGSSVDPAVLELLKEKKLAKDEALVKIPAGNSMRSATGPKVDQSHCQWANPIVGLAYPQETGYRCYVAALASGIHTYALQLQVEDQIGKPIKLLAAASKLYCSVSKYPSVLPREHVFKTANVHLRGTGYQLVTCSNLAVSHFLNKKHSRLPKVAEVIGNCAPHCVCFLNGNILDPGFPLAMKGTVGNLARLCGGQFSGLRFAVALAKLRDVSDADAVSDRVANKRGATKGKTKKKKRMKNGK